MFFFLGGGGGGLFFVMEVRSASCGLLLIIYDTDCGITVHYCNQQRGKFYCVF